jgi:hypothetical protein
MQTRIVQVQPEPWPSGYGEAMAVLELSLTELAHRHSLRLYEGTDNLGDYHAAVLRLPSGRRVGLLRHMGLPENETEVYADAHDDPDAVARELLDALGLPLSTCTWLQQRAPASAGSTDH